MVKGTDRHQDAGLEWTGMAELQCAMLIRGEGEGHKELPALGASRLQQEHCVCADMCNDAATLKNAVVRREGPYCK